MNFKKIMMMILGTLWAIAFTTTALAGNRYKVFQKDFSPLYTNYQPHGFVIDGATGQKITDQFYGLATDGKGDVVAILVGSQSDILEFRDTAEGETGHVAGTVQMSDRVFTVVNFNGVDGNPDHASFYCLPEIGDEVVVALKSVGGTKVFANSFSIFDSDGDGKLESLFVVGASENAEGRMMPTLWQGTVDVCNAPNDVTELPLPSDFDGSLEKTHGLASAITARSGVGLKIAGVVTDNKHPDDYLVSWNRQSNGSFLTQVVAANNKDELEVADAWVTPFVGQDLGVVGTMFDANADTGPHPFALQQNSLGEWEEIILSWDGTSMATPHFMDYTEDDAVSSGSYTSSSTGSSSSSSATSDFGAFVAGGMAFVEDRTYDYEIALLWKGVSGFTGSDEEIQALKTARTLDVNFLAEDMLGFGFIARDVVDHDPASGTLLVKTSDEFGAKNSAAILTPSSSLVPEIFLNNLTAEVTDGPYSVWNQPVDKFASEKIGSSGAYNQGVDVTANFMDYTPDSVVSLDLTVSGYATFPSSNSKDSTATVAIFFPVDETGGVWSLAHTASVAAGDFTLNITGMDPPPAISGLLKCRLQITAPEKQKFEVEISGLVFHHMTFD